MGTRVEQADESDDEQVRIAHRVQESAIELGEDLRGFVQGTGEHPNRILDEGGVHGGLQTLTADVGDDDQPA